MDGSILNFLYTSPFGRLILKLLTKRSVSRTAGTFLDSPVSKPLIPPFVRKYGIDLSEYQTDKFSSFNDFFTRKIKPELRPFETDCSVLPSPCDGFVSAYEIKDGTVLPVKQSGYTVNSLLRDDRIASYYKDGIAVVIRLAVDNYHRYGYIDNGRKGKNIFINGILHTVRPVALKTHSVFTENCREYTVMETENFGKVVQAEVGALLVGKISNHHEEYAFSRGEEKGLFLYGGSTVILLFEKGRVTIDGKYMTDKETPVKMGERIGKKTAEM